MQLRCDGFQEEFSVSDLEPGGRSSREPTTFTLRIQLSSGLAEITGLPLFALVANDSSLRFTISDTVLSHESEYSLSNSEGKFNSSLSIDRYSGIAYESQVITAKKGNVMRIFSGQYNCVVLKEKLF